MAATIAAPVALFAIRGIIRRRDGTRFWLTHATIALAPVALFAVPWLLSHYRSLYAYYVVANVDVGSASTMRAAAVYNFGEFASAAGSPYALLLAAGAAWAVFFRRIEWLEVLALVVAATIPLALLIASRSVGNFLVCQTSLGLPALLLACTQPKDQSRPGENLAWVMLGTIVLVNTAVGSLRTIRYGVAAVRAETRVEALQALVQIASAQPGGKRLGGFQAFPVDPVGLTTLAREQHIDLQPGPMAFHPPHFGIANAAVSTISEPELRAAITKTVGYFKSDDTLLMLPTAESIPLLPPVPYSHGKMKMIRAIVEADASFTRVLTTNPINGVRFDIFRFTKP